MTKSVILCAVLFLFFTPFSMSVVAQENSLEALKKENELLKKEVELLKKQIELLKEENSRLKTQAGGTGNGNTNKEGDGGAFIGKLWELDTLKPDGSVFSTVEFFAADGKVYFDKREVGTYTERGTRVRIDITRNVDARALGTAELLRVSNDPPMYQGRFTNKRGENPIVRLRAIVD